MSETSQIKENLKLMLWSIIENFKDLEDEKALDLTDNILSVLPDLLELPNLQPPEKYKIILRAKNCCYCDAQWVDEDTIQFKKTGWYDTIVTYKVNNGLYHKIFFNSTSMNGLGHGKCETYQDLPGITEDQLMNEITKMFH